MTPQEIEALIVALTHQTWEGSDSHPDWRAAPDRAATALRALAEELGKAPAVERERIARMLELEAETLPCAEDAAVTRANAMLVRGDGSYDEAEAIESRIGAAERERDRLVAENVRLREIERAAGDVLDEVDRILAVDPPPIKYRAPYGTLARLRGALARAALNPTGDDNGR